LGDVASTLHALERARPAIVSGLRSPAPALDVAPLFPALERMRDLSDYPLWNEACFADPPVAQPTFAIAWPGTEYRS
ncbi:MAG: hypothetical protein ABI431_09350, partial [Candidatus Tumulicola sp.]